MAGPYDLKATIDTVISWGKYDRPILMAYLMNSYDHYYGWNRLGEIFKQPYAGDIPGYFNGLQFMDAINNRLPMNLDSVLLETFITGYTGEGEQELKTALTDNSLLDFTPAAPVRLIHGTGDITVPYGISVMARDFYQSQGKTNVELVPVEGNHLVAAETAIVGAMLWFESLRNE
jgi:hypothetical protein